MTYRIQTGHNNGRGDGYAWAERHDRGTFATTADAYADLHAMLRGRSPGTGLTDRIVDADGNDVSNEAFLSFCARRPAHASR